MATPDKVRFPELGIYPPPGHSDRPAAWISERFDVERGRRAAPPQICA